MLIHITSEILIHMPRNMHPDFVVLVTRHSITAGSKGTSSSAIKRLISSFENWGPVAGLTGAGGTVMWTTSSLRLSTVAPFARPFGAVIWNLLCLMADELGDCAGTEVYCNAATANPLGGRIEWGLETTCA
jgi:hypothetical protein